jgi:hypothetical protein
MKNNKSLSRISQFDEINAFMESHLDKWNSIEEIRKTYDEFINKLKKIKELQPELDRDLSPLKKEMNDRQEILLRKLFPVGNILEVYAQDHKLGKKAGSLLISGKSLDSMDTEALLKHSRRLYKFVDRHIESTIDSEIPSDKISQEQGLKRYGLTKLMLDDIHIAIQQFQSSVQLNLDVLSYQKKTRKKRNTYVRANRKLLKNRLNKLMTVFSGTHPSFYLEYSRLGQLKKT